MAVAPMIAMKSTKCESLQAVGKELDRRAHTYANDVDPTRSHLNHYYRVRQGDERAMPLEEALERRMGELNTRRAVRKDAVRAMGFVISTNDALDDERAHEFLRESLHWFGRRYGFENLLAAAEHFDEGTPHLQLWLAPVIHDDETGYDRLCAKELFAPDKRKKVKDEATGKVSWEVTAQGTMSQLQQDFWEQVASRYGYERPLDHAKRAKGYRSLEAYKSHVGLTRELQEDAQRARERAAEALEAANEAQSAREAAEAARDGVQRQLDKKAEELGQTTERLERLRRDEDGIAAEIAELQPLAETVAESTRYLAEHRGDGERAERLAAEIEQLRGRVGEVEAEAQRVEADAVRCREAAGRAEAERAASAERVAGMAGLRERLERSCRGLEQRVGLLADEFRRTVGGIVWNVSEYVRDVLGGFGIDARTEGPSLDWMLGEAREAADWYDQRVRGWDEPSRGRSWGPSR